MENARVADLLDRIADLLDLEAESRFRIRAYRNAARAVRDLSVKLENLAARGEDLARLPAIGRSISQEIGEILAAGTCKRLEELEERVPPGLVEIMHVPGLGPRKAMEVWRELGVTSLGELQEAAREGRLRDLPGMGEKTEENVLRGLATVSATIGRITLKAASERLESLGSHLDAIEGIVRWEAAGSYRRRRETIGDLDVLVQAEDRARVVEEILAFPDIAEVSSRGEERTSVRLGDGLQVDFRFFEPESFGAALLYFTGSKTHNVELRQRAQRKGWKLNEYGLFAGDRRLAGASEEAVYRRLGLAWIPPELRESHGEIQAAAGDALPALVETGDLRGDLHCHTTASDGRDSIEEMAKAARGRGYRYLAITDHSQAVRVANGLDERRLRRHAARIREIDETLDRFWLLAGVEVDILRDGRLDLREDVLGELDWVVASIHSHFGLGESEMTRRILAAVTSGVVDCLGHPLGRRLGHRDPIRFDLDEVFAACAENGVCIEINAQPHRLDLPWIHCRRAVEAGVRLVISTDAHRTSELGLIDYGVGEARRGWVEAACVLNTMNLTELRRTLGSR